MYDVVIIGAGVIGCSIARELSKYMLGVLVLEKENDICSGTSKANSGIVHAGFDAKPDTLKGKLNAKSNLMFDNLAEELGIDFKRNGSLVLCFNKKDIYKLEQLEDRGKKNGVPGLRLLDGDKVRQMEPNVSERVVAALYAPTAGIVCPFSLTIALAENANTNGVQFKFNSEVVDLKKENNSFIVITKEESIKSKIVINASGLYSDKINNLISKEKFYILPRKGEYNLFDKYVGNLVSKTFFQLPTGYGKGVLVTPTVDGNLLIGPNATDISDKEDLSVTREGLNEINEKAQLSLKDIPIKLIITSFSGLRARTETEDFIISEASDVEGFINVAGIDSPGLSCAPLISIKVSELVASKLKAKINKNFNGRRKALKRFSDMTMEEKKKIIKENPSYGTIVCRCELVTEAEIIDAINRPLGATDLDGVKRRTRAGAGRCQCGFCISRIMGLLNKEKNIPMLSITKFGKDSNILRGKVKDDL